ncbi:hypothetical protein JAAARDRAFT_195592 [Jaapia argillacea MUCL 33604]|uniref:F-box domain-containing protein n=1 Tax=Jaapia argillacea MUCL 33604 TaxID=933084 RepID=A0A067PLR8_9AGAM|nr:hypothetical protein JAAARDRAFT_195592 [Jaapia argillacea MUCL 33604]
MSSMVTSPFSRPEQHNVVSKAGRLPAELLHEIFQLALPPDCITDPSWEFDPVPCWSIAWRDKLSFTLVCRSWMSVGTELLYEHVAIRHATQLPLLVRTAKSPSFDFGRLIKTFTLRCFIPHLEQTVFFDDLVTLYSHCPRLRRFILSPHWDSPNPSAVVDSLCSSIPLASITHRGVNADMLPSTIDSFLDRCSSLRSLSLVISTEAFSPKSVHLPRLEELRINLLPLTEEDVFSTLTGWVMPCLTSLVISDSRYISNRLLMPFLRTHGAHLKFLHFWDHEENDSPRHGDRLVSNCPRLEHFVMPIGGLWPTSHPTLMYVDVWGNPSIHRYLDSGIVRSMRRLPLPSLPALRNFRQLDRSLICIQDLPQISPPHSTIDGDCLKHDFLGLTLTQTNDRLVAHENEPGVYPHEEQGLSPRFHSHSP